jgi:hypothetical protein
MAQSSNPAEPIPDVAFDNLDRLSIHNDKGTEPEVAEGDRIMDRELKRDRKRRH